MSDLDFLLKQLKDAGISSDTISHKIGRLKVGNVEIEDLEVDPNNPRDIDAATTFVRNAVEAGEQSPATTEPTLEDSPSLADAISQYINEKTAHDNNVWSERTHSEYRQLYDLLLLIVGKDIAVDELSKKIARDVKNKLLKLPANLSKVKKYQGKTIDEIIALGDKPRSITTTNKILIRYSSLFCWLKEQGYISENYFSGLTISVGKKQSDERGIYSESQLDELFKQLKSYSSKKTAHSYYYWLPRIALYTGMRLEEISQLYLSDISKESDIWVFNVNDEREKSLKNLTAKRLVPIHSALITLGLLEHVENLRNQGASRLFPELKKINGRYSHSASNWFSRVREKLGWMSLTPKLDFHSFRHCVATKLQHENVPEYRVAAILGHSIGDSESFTRYAKGATITMMREDIELINYSVDMSTV